ncbi:MAG: efflux RND transporter permease subunit [Myxococcota bacterium]
MSGHPHDEGSDPSPSSPEGFVAKLGARPRLVVAVAMLLSLLGVASWFGMPREEDPKIAARAAIIVAPFPGASAVDVERLVVTRIEEELAEVEDIDHVDVTVRTGVAVLTLRLRNAVTKGNTDDVWDEVRDALERAEAEMPAAALPPRLDDELMETEAVLVALHGVPDVLEVADAADALERALLAIDDVQRVVITGDPGARMTVDIDDVTARRLGVDPLSLAQSLEKRNVRLPSGSLHLGPKAVPIRPSGDLMTRDEVASLPVGVNADRAGRAATALPLAEFADVGRAVDTPRSARARYGGAPAVFVGVIPRDGIQAEVFGSKVQAAIDQFTASRPELSVDVVAFQPDRVAGRLTELGGSLVLGVGIVAGVVLLLMGLRMGLVVASIVPLVVFAAVSVYAAGGGVLHQIAVAALVIALGLLVDNAIVVAELIQRHLDDGMAPEAAARTAVRELTLPLGAATATTLASFVPMLLADGNSGDFTRAIPIMVMVTLVVSYGYALLVTPLAARFGLRARPGRTGGSRLDQVAGAVGTLAARRPWITLGSALVVVAASGSFAAGVGFNFFPTSDRNQVMVEVELPEGTHLAATDATTRVLERWLDRRDDVQTVASFVGRSAPHFYYNLPTRPQAPHIAQIMVVTRRAEDVDPLRRALEDHARQRTPEATVLAKRLEQGPPVRAPVHLRLYGEDLGDLHLAATRVRAMLRDLDGTRHVRDDQGFGLPTLELQVDDAAALRHGVDRERVALALLAQARGMPAGSFRGGADPIPMVLRSRASQASGRGDATGPDVLLAADIPRPGLGPLPLLEVARPEVAFAPAVIHRRDRSRVVNVYAENAPGVTYAAIMGQASAAMDDLELPAGVRWDVGGAVAESAAANRSLGAKGPYGALLLVLVLLAEFNSFRRVLIVLATAPLAALGIWPGLFLAGLPFGFVALLGAIALIGIAVNGAIVLIDVADRERAAGADVQAALTTAVRLRTRPILLTTATTVAGLAPLLFSASTLWPPMAAAMISGLVVSTLLTLGVVPALYRLLLSPRRRRRAAAT